MYSVGWCRETVIDSARFVLYQKYITCERRSSPHFV